MFVVYDSPLDYRGKTVVRLWSGYPQIKVTKKIIILEEGHWKLQANTNKKYEHWKGYEIDFNGIGKVVFCTHEEAEKALKERENK